MMIIVWSVLLLVFLVFEAVTVQLVSIWFALGSLGALITALCGGSVLVQTVVFVLASLASLIATRPLAKKFLNNKRVSTNADQYVGQEALVTQTVNNRLAQGVVKVSGSVWSAKSADDTVIPEGSMVLVEKIEGVKAVVKIK